MKHLLVRPVRRGTLVLLLCCPSLALRQAQAAAQDLQPPRWTASLGVAGVSPQYFYRGRVYVQDRNQSYGSQYQERSGASLGLVASWSWRTQRVGELALTVSGMQTESTGSYSGIAAPETHDRSLLMIGADVGWRLVVWRSGMITFRVPLGPALAWHRLKLSDGHRDAYSNPGGTERPQVRWSDRDWVSLGGHAGLSLILAASSHLSLWVGGTARFLYASTNGWAGREESDIQRSTGNVVYIQYVDPLFFQASLETGLEWRP